MSQSHPEKVEESFHCLHVSLSHISSKSQLTEASPF
jgi:hypothetical protein